MEYEVKYREKLLPWGLDIGSSLAMDRAKHEESGHPPQF